MSAPTTDRTITKLTICIIFSEKLDFWYRTIARYLIKALALNNHAFFCALWKEKIYPSYVTRPLENASLNLSIFNIASRSAIFLFKIFSFWITVYHSLKITQKSHAHRDTWTFTFVLIFHDFREMCDFLKLKKALHWSVVSLWKHQVERSGVDCRLTDFCVKTESSQPRRKLPLKSVNQQKLPAWRFDRDWTESSRLDSTRLDSDRAWMSEQVALPGGESGWGRLVTLPAEPSCVR